MIASIARLAIRTMSQTGNPGLPCGGRAGSTGLASKDGDALAWMIRVKSLGHCWISVSGGGAAEGVTNTCVAPLPDTGALGGAGV